MVDELPRCSKQVGINAWFTCEFYDYSIEQYKVLEWFCTHWKKFADATKAKEEIMKEPPAKKQKTERNNTTKLVDVCKKIRLYPNGEDRYNLEQWFSANRWTYNQALQGIKYKKIKPTKTFIRAHFVNRSVFKHKSPISFLDRIT
jgi:hypoxanthine phosphoribosyltransferase